MTTHSGLVSRRRVARLALAVLGPPLAAALFALGFSLLLDGRGADDLARLGIGPGSRLLLGAAHLAGGAALLTPPLAGPAAILLGLAAGATAAYLVALGRGVMAGGPALTAVVLIAFGVSSALRSRAAERSWCRMLMRYGERADAGGSRAS